MRNCLLRTHEDGSVTGARTKSVSLILESLAMLLLIGPFPLLPGISTAAAELLENVHVHYAHNWVAGHTEAEAEVVVTVTDEHGGPKGATTVPADESGNFFVDCPAYHPNPCPDINPGDTVVVSATGLEHAVEPVGVIEGSADEVLDTISGVLHANWLTGPVDVRCEIWMPPGAPPVDATADPDGGTFSCDFSGAWDLHFGHAVALSYFDPDGDRVTSMLVWPWMRVNYAHDWAGGNYPAGHGVWVTNLESDGATSDIEWVQRSGDLAFDLEAHGAVEAAGRARAFGPLPAAWPRDQLRVSFFFDPASL